MSSRIHQQARTTPKIRQEIEDSGLSSREAAKVFNITRATAQKWLGRDDAQDRSHRAHTLHTTLSQAQEAIVLALRQSLYLPLDDLLFITKEYINPAVSRAGIARLLKREGMSRLTDLIATAEGEKITPKKTFKDYEPGFIHIDIKYLPQMPDETSRHPQTNGMVERFNGRINELLQQTGFDSRADLQAIAELSEAVQPPYSTARHRQ